MHRYAKLEATANLARLREYVDERHRPRGKRAAPEVIGGAAREVIERLGGRRQQSRPQAVLRALCWPLALLSPLANLSLLFYCIYTAAAVAGLLVHPFYFAVGHPLHPPYHALLVRPSFFPSTHAPLCKRSLSALLLPTLFCLLALPLSRLALTLAGALA